MYYQPMAMTRAIPFIIILILFLTGTIDVRGEEQVDDQILAKNVKARRRQARTARQAVWELDLSRRQARLLLPIIEKAATLHIEAYEQGADLLPEMIEAFTGFARQDSLNQGFSSKIERRTIKINKKAKQVRERRTEQLITLEEQVASILSPSQRELAEYTKPGRRAPRKGRPVKNDPLAAAKQELKDLRQQLHPQLGKLGRHLLHPAAGEALSEIVGSSPSKTIQRGVGVLAHGTASYPIAQYDKQKADVKRLRVEINHWNLINGLHLSDRQIEGIVAQYNEATKEPSLVTEKGKSKLPRGVITKLEQSIEAILNSGQLVVLADYKACLIPPKNLKNPVLVGQAKDHSRLEKWLSRARSAPDKRLKKLVDQALDKEVQLTGQLSFAQRRQRRNLLIKTARQAAKMTDADFELSKAELAERIAPRDRVKELRAEIAGLSQERGLPGPVAKHMLKPRFIEQLQQRGRQLAKGCTHTQTDLASGPQAENCKKGCAIDKKRK